MATRNLVTRTWTPAASTLGRCLGTGMPPPARFQFLHAVPSQVRPSRLHYPCPVSITHVVGAVNSIFPQIEVRAWILIKRVTYPIRDLRPHAGCRIYFFVFCCGVVYNLRLCSPSAARAHRRNTSTSLALATLPYCSILNMLVYCSTNWYDTHPISIGFK